MVSQVRLKNPKKEKHHLGVRPKIAKKKKHHLGVRFPALRLPNAGGEIEIPLPVAPPERSNPAQDLANLSEFPISTAVANSRPVVTVETRSNPTDDLASLPPIDTSDSPQLTTAGTSSAPDVHLQARNNPNEVLANLHPMIPESPKLSTAVTTSSPVSHSEGKIDRRDDKIVNDARLDPLRERFVSYTAAKGETSKKEERSPHKRHGKGIIATPATNETILCPKEHSSPQNRLATGEVGVTNEEPAPPQQENSSQTCHARGDVTVTLPAGIGQVTSTAATANPDSVLGQVTVPGATNTNGQNIPNGDIPTEIRHAGGEVTDPIQVSAGIAQNTSTAANGSPNIVLGLVGTDSQSTGNPVGEIPVQMPVNHPVVTGTFNCNVMNIYGYSCSHIPPKQ